MTDVDGPTRRADRESLTAELGVLRARLRAVAGSSSGQTGANEITDSELAAARAKLPGPTPLDLLAEGFGLTPFERAVLLLAAGPELVAAVADELEAACGRTRPSFGLAMALLPDPHWGAMTAAAPLRRWRLVRLLDPTSPAHSPLVVDERVLHHVAGAGHLDAELSAVARIVPAPAWLPTPLQAASADVTRRWAQERAVLLHGPQPANLHAVAAAAAARTGLRLLSIPAADLPIDPTDRDRTLRLMERETVLSGCAWAIDLVGARPEDVAVVSRALTGLEAPVAVVGDVADSVQAGALRATPVAVPRLDVAHRRELLGAVLRRHDAPHGPIPVTDIDAAAGVFDLDLEAAEVAAHEVSHGGGLWDACRRTGRAALSGLAVVVQPRATWKDLVLPESQLDQLRALVAAVRYRAMVLDDWGFGARTTRGLGTTALFAGPSGTGKTLAGEVIAGAVGLDLVHVDLSQVVSKYIGETEKNLCRLFDAAEDAAAVLLFDEADTLFGRRSEVRDSHDRYANLEVGYLLQRMENFRGLAILTTNDRSALDPAFLRRLHTIVSFPYPDRAAREALWRIAFPPRTPLAGIEPAVLAQIDLTGGGIAAAALGAAYLAADNRGSVRSKHVRIAARWELAKSGRVLPEERT